MIKKIIKLLLILIIEYIYLCKEATSITIPEGSMILGNIKAPVTLIAYSSLTCFHCAKFYTKTLAKAKQKYIDKGLLKFILILFPLNQLDIKITLILESTPPIKKWPILIKLYQTQLAWIQSRNEKEFIKKISKTTGLNNEFIKNTINNKKKLAVILKKRIQIRKNFNIKTTPIFISGIHIWKYSISMKEINNLCKSYE